MVYSGKNSVCMASSIRPVANGVGVPFQGLGHAEHRPLASHRAGTVAPGASATQSSAQEQPVASSCHCSSGSISLTPITIPSLTPRRINPTPLQLYPMLAAFHLGFGLALPRGAVLRQVHPPRPLQAVRVGHYLRQRRPRFAVRPIDRRLALDAKRPGTAVRGLHTPDGDLRHQLRNSLIRPPTDCRCPSPQPVPGFDDTVS